MFFDDTVTDVPDDGAFYLKEEEGWKNYSLHHRVIVGIIEPLKAAGPPLRVS